MSELYEYVQGVFLTGAIVSTLMAPRKPTFNVTAKGESLDNDLLSELSWPFFSIWGLLLAGVAARRLALYLRSRRQFADAGGGPVERIQSDHRRRGAGRGRRAQAGRPYPRLAIARHGQFLLRRHGEWLDVAITNVSAGGCAIEPLKPFAFSVKPDMTRARLRIK